MSRAIIICAVDELIFEAAAPSKVARVCFANVTGFRVLDESDLCEFWRAGISLRTGWLFEVETNGWLDQEKCRADFLSARTKQLSEYLAVGVNLCVSVLSVGAPKITWL